IGPEGGPINPSPWGGFHARATTPDAGALSIRVNYGAYAHRYPPKTSADGEAWRALPASETTLLDDGGAVIRVRPGQGGLYVSAQENIGNDRYEAWLNTLAKGHPGARLMEIGRSVEGRPIRALHVNPEAPRHLLLLGRQHPPEVTGALALMSFMERLLAKRREACVQLGPDCAFFKGHGLMLAPNLNPDGVARGHWRHNLRGVDLNRDWGAFTQPETQAIRDWVGDLEAAGQSLALVLDFHSTYRNVFYVQDADSPTDRPAFARRWLARATAAGNPVPFEYAPRPLTDLGTAKNYFHARFGVPSITYELADEEDRGAIAASAAVTADALVATLAESDGLKSQRQRGPLLRFSRNAGEVGRYDQQQPSVLGH
ncbi:MAG: M14 family metallopeptidase, partial [Gammaproteobacteria bacterium]|nr:M14 family metallopeptidase [Gammaproteobacteria bacterium]